MGRLIHRFPGWHGFRGEYGCSPVRRVGARSGFCQLSRDEFVNRAFSCVMKACIVIPSLVEGEFAADSDGFLPALQRSSTQRGAK